MVKVIDPEGTIVGVYENAYDVPDEIPNRMGNFDYPKSECRIMEVTDPKDYQRLLPCLNKE